MNSEIELILTKLKIVSEAKENGAYICDKEHSKILLKEIERLNKILNDIDTYIHLWKIDDIGEKTMLILNDILLIKNGMRDEVIRLKEVNK